MDIRRDVMGCATTYASEVAEMRTATREAWAMRGLIVYYSCNIPSDKPRRNLCSRAASDDESGDACEGGSESCVDNGSGDGREDVRTRTRHHGKEDKKERARERDVCSHEQDTTSRGQGTI